MAAGYTNQPRKRRWPKWLAVLLAVGVIITVGSVAYVRQMYTNNLKPVSNNQKRITVTIPLGSSLKEISALLKQQNVVRSDWAFERYVRNAGLENNLKAGTYALRQSQSVQEIVTILTGGLVSKDLVTIFPASRLDQIENSLINSGFSEQSVVDALKPERYANHPAIVDKPAGANLEGYLYPESFHKTADTLPEQIIEQSLDEMQKRLTPAIRNGIVRKGLTVYEGIILASIIENEVSGENPQDRPRVAQVFLKRLGMGMKLESDATTPYGAVLAGSDDYERFDSPYNTYLYAGLPPTPISNVSESSLQAVVDSATTDFLYFVTGNDCETRFSHTLEEHERLQREYGVGCDE